MRFLAAAMVALSLTACSRPKDSTELVGKYLANYDQASENLRLEGNGNYSQTVTLKSGGKSNTANGKWKYDPSSGYIYFDEKFFIVLDGFGHLIPNFEQVKRDGLVVEPVTRFMGRISLGGSPGIEYLHE